MNHPPACGGLLCAMYLVSLLYCTSIDAWVIPCKTVKLQGVSTWRARCGVIAFSVRVCANVQRPLNKAVKMTDKGYHIMCLN